MQTLGQLSGLATLLLAFYGAEFFGGFRDTASPFAVAFAVLVFVGIGGIAALTLFALFVEAPRIEVAAMGLNAMVALPALGLFFSLLPLTLLDRSADRGAAAVVLEPCLLIGSLLGCNLLALWNQRSTRDGGPDLLTLFREATQGKRGTPRGPESSEPGPAARTSAARPEPAPRPVPRVPPPPDSRAIRPNVRAAPPRPIAPSRGPSPQLNPADGILRFRRLVRWVGGLGLLGLGWLLAANRLIGLPPSRTPEPRSSRPALNCPDLHVTRWRVVPRTPDPDFVLDITLRPDRAEPFVLKEVRLFGVNGSRAAGVILGSTQGQLPDPDSGEIRVNAILDPRSLMGEPALLIRFAACAASARNRCLVFSWGESRLDPAFRGSCGLPRPTELPEFMAPLRP